MKTLFDLYQAVRSRFPEIAARADEDYIPRWGAVTPEFVVVWFESLANVLNSEMRNTVPYKTHAPLFDFFSGVVISDSPEIPECINTGFVEGLFWKVSEADAQPYWQMLPQRLKDLYVDFHRRAPC